MRTPEEQVAYEMQRREQRRECERRRRAAKTAEDRAREAERKRQARQNNPRREAENAAMRSKYHATRGEESGVPPEDNEHWKILLANALEHYGYKLSIRPGFSCAASQTPTWAKRRKDAETQCTVKFTQAAQSSQATLQPKTRSIAMQTEGRRTPKTSR